ncbi:YdeI/OmpD-associated family protein [Archangium sp.]|uniref:YdeI/OmpD-associated family protein n=1 Tax=Archangium sp. TaxID=1872627 RepID=UPI002EDAA506
MSEHRFEGRLVRPDAPGSWTFVMVPAAVSKALGSRGRIPVQGTVNERPLQGSLMPDGEGGHFLVVNKALRDAAGVDVGDSVEVVLRVDTAERRVEVPPELAEALATDAEAQRTFEAFSYSHQKEYADWVGEAKKAETRLSRARKAVGLVREKKRLKG